MQSLQHANAVLSESGFAPFFICKYQFIRDKFISSPVAIEIFCPVNILNFCVSKISDIIGGDFNITYHVDDHMIDIAPGDAKFQYIVNLLYNCETAQQVYSVVRLVEIHYPHNAELHSIVNNILSSVS